MIEQAAVTSKGIKELLKSYDWEEAIAEYIWNGFDACASEVKIEFEFQPEPFESINSITIIDNGHGIPKSELRNKFKPIYESEKARSNAQPKNHSLPHGRNGKGRLTFYTFADEALWKTHYLNDGAIEAYQVKIKAAELDKFTPTPTSPDQSHVGTSVRFTDVREVTKTSIDSKLRPYLRREFAWFLELYSDFKILIDGTPLEYGDIVLQKEDFILNEHSTKDRFEVRFVLWSERSNEEYSKYYFLNSGNKEVWKHNTTLNNKGDNFYHSVFIKGAYFDEFQWEVEASAESQQELFPSQKSEKFKTLLSRLSDFLHQKRNPFIKTYTEKLVAEYESEGVFPPQENSPLSTYRKEALKDTVKELYKVQPKIFSSLNITQKKAFVGLLDALLELGADDRLLEIISKIVEMTPAERTELAHILEYASMSSITKLIGMIKDRMKVVCQLKRLVLDEDWGADEGHIQKIVENHYWLFGEQFNLTTAEEPDFEEALRRYIHLLRGDGETRKPKINHPDKNKEMDIFATRKVVSHDRIDNILVELKHPTVKLGRKELNQTDTYLGVICSQPEFTAQNMHWKMILVGKAFDTSESVLRDLENAKVHGEPYLVRKNPSIRCSVYVMRWSDVFLEFECRHEHLLKQLEFNKARLMEDLKRQKSADEVASDAASNTAAERASWDQPREPIGNNIPG